MVPVLGTGINHPRQARANPRQARAGLPLRANPSILTPNCIISFEHPFVRGKPFQPDRAAGVQFLGGDGYLPSQPQLGTVGEARAGVDVDSSGVDFVDKTLRVGWIVGEDAIRVLCAVVVDVLDRLVDGIDYANAKYQTEPFLVKVALFGCQDAVLRVEAEDLQG